MTEDYITIRATKPTIMKASHKTILLILSSLLMIVQCKKEEIQAQPIIPQTPQQLILDKWDLKYTLYKDPFDTFYLAQHNMKTTYNFFSNDTVLVNSYNYGILDTFTSGKKYYKISNYILAIDTFPGLVINGSSSIMSLSPNSLTLDTRHKDGDYKFFSKLP